MAFWCEEVLLPCARRQAESWLALAVVIEFVFQTGFVRSRSAPVSTARRVQAAERHLAKFQEAYDQECRLKHHQSLHCAMQPNNPFLCCFPGERKNKSYKSACAHTSGKTSEAWGEAIATRILLDAMNTLPDIKRGTHLINETLATDRDDVYTALSQARPGVTNIWYAKNATIEGLRVGREDCLVNAAGEVMVAELFAKVQALGVTSFVVLGKPCIPIAGTRKLTSSRYDVVQVYVDWGLEGVVRACEYAQNGHNRIVVLRLNI